MTAITACCGRRWYKCFCFGGVVTELMLQMHEVHRAIEHLYQVHNALLVRAASGCPECAGGVSRYDDPNTWFLTSAHGLVKTRE